MPLTKAKKHEQVERLAGELKDSKSAIIGTFAKLTVAQDFSLRKTVRNAGGHYRVVKNKLAAISSRGTEVEGALQGLKGVSSVAYTSGDPVALAKALSDWVKDNAEFTFKLGIIDGKVISIQEIDQLAKMPGKEELFSKLLFLISSPAQRLVTVMNAVGRDLAVVIDQAVKEEKFKAAAAAPAAAAPAAEASAPAAGAAPAPVAETAPAVPAAEAATPAEEAKAPETEAAPAPVAEAASETADAVQPAGHSTDPAEGATEAEASAPVAAVEPEKQAEAAATEEPVEGAAVDTTPATEETAAKAEQSAEGADIPKDVSQS